MCTLSKTNLKVWLSAEMMVMMMIVIVVHDEMTFICEKAMTDLDFL